MMKPSPPVGEGRREPMLRAMREGVAFLVAPSRAALDRARTTGYCGLDAPVRSAVPAFAVNVLHAGARGLGWAVSAIGAGGFGGALLTAYFAQRERRSRLWLQSALLMSFGVLALAFVPSLKVALGVLFLIGVGTMAFMGATNTLIQILSPDEVRGRALSVYTMIAIGIVPLGSLVDGAIAAAIGLERCSR